MLERSRPPRPCASPCCTSSTILPRARSRRSRRRVRAASPRGLRCPGSPRRRGAHAAPAVASRRRPFGREVIDAYASADLVISAPGGPYFGDIYADHEALHWAYVLLGACSGARVPVRDLGRAVPTRWMNPRPPVRGSGGSRSRRARARSAEYLRELFGPQPDRVEVTIDAALGAEVDAAAARVAGHGLHAATTTSSRCRSSTTRTPAIPIPRGTPAPRRSRRAALVARSDTPPPSHMCFAAGARTARDTPYLETPAARLPDGVSHEVLSDRVPSRTQQRIFASAELVLAGRYHPRCSRCSARCPSHVSRTSTRASGSMDAAGLGHLVDADRDVTTERLVALVDEASTRHPQIRDQLPTSVRTARRTRARTADLAVGDDAAAPTAPGPARPAAAPPAHADGMAALGRDRPGAAPDPAPSTSSRSAPGRARWLAARRAPRTSASNPTKRRTRSHARLARVGQPASAPRRRPRVATATSGSISCARSKCSNTSPTTRRISRLARAPRAGGNLS